MNKYLVIDTETGGTNLECSLLTAYFAILDENFQIRDNRDELHLFVKPDDGMYHVQAEAMTINKINLVEHDKIAVSYKQAKTILYQFLEESAKLNGFQRENKQDFSKQLTPIGHGVRFDIEFITHYLISKPTWDQFVSYRSLDTSSAIQFLLAAGLFPSDVSGSLGSVLKYFGIKPIGELHTARTDALGTVSVLTQLLKLVTPITEVKVVSPK